MAKRLFDLVVAGVALLVLLPFMVLLALWIRLDSPGAALYRQERVGRLGRTFRIHKFRTMRTDAAGLPLTVGHDPRITRAGRWLRRTRLDELPQLVDVVVGNMSLVGPRPEVPRYVAHYPEALKRRVLAVRPGITDPASLDFLDEAGLLAVAEDPERTYIDQVLPRKLLAAAEYAERASLRTDVMVIARTLRLLLSRH